METKHLQKTILSYPPLKNYIGDSRLEKNNCLKHLEEIRADYSPVLIKKLRELIDPPLAKMYDSINFDVTDNLDLLQLTRENNVVFVPNHQSHLDYLAINWALHCQYNFQIPVHIAGGINLNIFPLGTLFRRSGCFFIRRNFANNKNYRYTFEAYLYYLLKENIPIEFFFEGGRSRTGKLRPPRFGLFSMLLDAHSILIEQGHQKPLLFIPISIMHEFVPEERILAKESEGRKKKKESSLQLLQLWRFLFKQFGTIHIKAGSPILSQDISQEQRRQMAHQLAFKCYHSVGAGMSVTPTALLSLIMLDDLSGSLTYETIVEKAQHILGYCQRFDVPVTSKLKDNLNNALKRALELLLKDKKIRLVAKEKLEQKFYVVEDNRRMELLYFKNSILHHFLIPFFMNSMLINIINDHIKTLDDLKNLLKTQRDLFKYEFYLPDMGEAVRKSLDILHQTIGRKVDNLEAVMELNTQEFFKVAKEIAPFSRAMSYIYEGYYVGALALKHFQNDHFNIEKFLKVAKEIHDMECQHGRLIRFNESYSTSLLKDALKYYENQGLIRQDGNFYLLINLQLTEKLIADLGGYLTEHLTFNLKTS